MQTEFITEIIQRKPRDTRCHNCGRLLGRFIKPPGSLFSIRCTRCGRMYHEDVPVDTTSVIVFLRALEMMNGSTPAGIVRVMADIVQRNESIV